MSEKKNGEKNSKKISEKISAGEQFNLTDQEQEKIRPFQTTVDQEKLTLAEIVIQIATLEAQRNVIIQRLVEAQNNLIKGVQDVLVERGIDLADTTRRWNVNTQAMSVTRTL